MSRSQSDEIATRHVGQSPPRPDGVEKVLGRATYVDDVVLPGLWHGATVRAGAPSARIRQVDLADLRSDPQLVVVGPEDLPGPNALALIENDWPVLAAGQVRHLNEPLALVAAPTREAARRAATSVRVELEELPAILDLEAALGKPPAGTGLRGELASCRVERGDVEAALAAADVVVEGTFHTGHQEHIYVENQGMIAIPGDDGGIEVLGSLQCPYYLKHALEHLLGDAVTSVRVRQVVTGGGFGGKEDYPDMIGAHAALLALAARRPVKLVYDRHEDIVATTKRHPSRVFHRTGVMRDGTLVAQDIEVLLDGGAYVTLSPVVLSRAVLHAGGPYRCPDVRIRGRVLATNTPPNGAFRGFGAPQTQFAAERQMDRIGRELGIDPLSLRRLNAYREGDETPTGQVLDASTAALDCLEEAARRSDFLSRWKEQEAARERACAADEPVVPGIGLSLSWHGSGFTGDGERRLAARAAVELTLRGRLSVLTGSTDFGQGTEVVFRQIAADAAGLGLEDVEVAVPDTAHVPDSGPTVASRTVMIVGGVLWRAAAELAGRVCAAVATEHGLLPEDVRLRDGRLLDAAGRELGSFAAAARTLVDREGPQRVEQVHQHDPAQSFDESRYRGTAYPAYGWASDVVQLEVDRDTLSIRPLRTTVACDVGRVIHPVLCRGQVEGGVLQALAWGYLEELKTEGGRYLNDRLSTYIVPTTLDTPEFDVVLLERPTAANPLGAKGVGELPMDGGAPALVAAIENATGISAGAIPATPERLFELSGGQGAQGAAPCA